VFERPDTPRPSARDLGTTGRRVAFAARVHRVSLDRSNASPRPCPRVYKFVSDLHFYVTGSVDENEIILATVLNGFYDSVSLLLRGVLEKRTVLENLDLVLLTLDEIVDGGLILETDANVIANRVSMRGADGDTPLTEQSFSQALASAKEQLTKNLLR
jgi:hypothetical protein